MSVCRFILIVGIASVIPALVTGQDAVTSCAVPVADTAGWIRRSVGPLLLQLPGTARGDTSAQAARGFPHGGGRWLDGDLVIEWGVSERANAGTAFDSGERRLTRQSNSASQILCLPTLPNGWTVRSSSVSIGSGGALMLWFLPPAPRESMYYIEFRAPSRAAWQRAITAARTLVLAPRKP